MDGPPAQSLGVEPADPDMVGGKPRSRNLKLLNKGLAIRVCINAFLRQGEQIRNSFGVLPLKCYIVIVWLICCLPLKRFYVAHCMFLPESLTIQF